MLIKAFSERWLSDKPRPEMLIPDCGKTMTAKSMHDFCNSVGVQLAFPPQKESWAHGIVEAAIQDVKMTATAIQTSSPEQNPEVTLYLAAAALHSTEYTRFQLLPVVLRQGLQHHGGGHSHLRTSPSRSTASRIRAARASSSKGGGYCPVNTCKARSLQAGQHNSATTSTHLQTHGPGQSLEKSLAC